MSPSSQVGGPSDRTRLDTVVDGRSQWKAYIAQIDSYGWSADRVTAALVARKLIDVRRHLQAVNGVVTKLALGGKAPTSELWASADRYVRQYLASRGATSVLHLPEKAYNQYSDYASPYDDAGRKFLNPRFQYFDVHHIWPETLGGPTEGWNVLPLPKDVHLYRLHPIMDDLVRLAQPGQRIRLL